MMIAKTPSTIAKRPNDSSENIGQSGKFPHRQGESSKNIETKLVHFLAKICF
jgi:hypothetical protein